MKLKRHLKYLLIFGVLIILCLVGILWSELFAPRSAVAEIYLDGQLQKKVHFAALSETIHIQVGEGNTLAADQSGIWMEHADCPDGLCIKQGKLQSGARSIICLPNRVSVVLSGESEMDGLAQ